MSGRIVVVTGAAKGIGRAILDRFVADGDHVLAVDVIDVSADLSDRQTTYHRIDVSDPTALEAFPQAAIDQFGSVDVLVNNAATRF